MMERNESDRSDIIAQISCKMMQAEESKDFDRAMQLCESLKEIFGIAQKVYGANNVELDTGKSAGDVIEQATDFILRHHNKGHKWRRGDLVRELDVRGGSEESKRILSYVDDLEEQGLVEVKENGWANLISEDAADILRGD